MFGFLPNAGALSVIGVGWFIGLVFVFYLCFPFFCTLQQTWRKNKSNFTDRQTPIGRVDKDFYLYIGPFDRNILELPEDAVLETGDRSYYFIKREAVCMGGQLLYYTGVMKRLQEGSYEVDNGSGDAGTGEAAG